MCSAHGFCNHCGSSLLLHVYPLLKVIMPPKQESLTCTQCEESLCRSRFSLRQRPRKSRICEQCAGDNVQVAPTLTCTRCLEPLERACFSPRQQQRAQRVCLHCTATPSASSTEVRATYRTCKVCTLTLPRHCFSNQDNTIVGRQPRRI